MKIRKFLNALLTMILGVMGFSCGPFGGDEYGCPSADFVMKGNVVNPQNQPVEGVKVVNTARVTEDAYMELEAISTTTDADGSYTISCDYYTLGSEVQGVSFRFVPDTTKYEVFDTVIPQKSIVFKGGDGDWYSGKAEVNVNVTLKEKK